MKVNEPPPVLPARIVGQGRSVPPPERSGGSGRDASASGQEEHAPDHDIAAVHGVESAEFTPSVQEAMANLIAEVSDLREALDHSHKRLDYLTMLADQDSVSSLLNRRAFVRELSRVLVLARQREIGSSLVFLEIGNLKEINIRHGMAAGDAAIEHTAGILQDEFSENTIVGRLGGAEFGLVLIGEAATAARVQSESLAASLALRPLVWEGIEIELTMQWGVHSLISGEDPNAAMNAADREMRGI